MKSKKGFTLIELLVVIAIIGLLSSVVLSSLNTARAKSRDSKRLADLHELRTALELYANSNSGSYPSTGGGFQGNCPDFGGYPLSGTNGYVPGLAPTHIATLPTDPKPVSTNGCYLYRSDGKNYVLLAFLTVETYTPTNNPAKRAITPTAQTFAVYTPGAASW